MAGQRMTLEYNRERGVAMVQVLVMTPFLIAIFVLFNYVGNAGQTHIGNRNFARECIWQYAQAGCPASGLSAECRGRGLTVQNTTSQFNINTENGSGPSVRDQLESPPISQFDAHDPANLLDNGVQQLELGDLTLSRTTQLPSNAFVGESSFVANLGLYCNTEVAAPLEPPAIEQFESTVCEAYGGFCDEI